MVKKFIIKPGGENERYLQSTKGCVLFTPSSGLRTVGGYLVLRPDEAESLVRELHHWLENERDPNGKV
jgi:hypothetical protein